MEAKRLYKATVEGQYFANTGGVRGGSIKKYSAEFILPSNEAALSVVVSKLLSPKLSMQYPDYTRYRTHRLVKLEMIGDYKPNRAVLELPVEAMSMAQLLDFCLLRGIMIDPYKRKNVEIAREQISLAWEEKKRLMRDNSAEAEAKKKDDALLELNNIPIEKGGVQVTMRQDIPAPRTVELPPDNSPAPLARVEDAVDEAPPSLPEFEQDSQEQHEQTADTDRADF